MEKAFGNDRASPGRKKVGEGMEMQGEVGAGANGGKRRKRSHVRKITVYSL